MTEFRRRLLAVPAGTAVDFLMLVFVLSAFALPSEAAYGLVFYILAVAAMVVHATRSRIWRDGEAWRSTMQDRAVIIALLLIGWSALTLLWGQDDKHRSLRFALGAACTATFLLAMLRGWTQSTAACRRLGTLLIWAGAINAAVSMAIYPYAPQEGDRLHGWGVTTHPILGASVMTAAFLAALVRAMAEQRLRIVHYAAALVMAAFILLTGSRGPLGAAFVATLFVCAAGAWRWRALAGLALCAVAWRLMPASIRHHQAAMLVGRGSSHRFEIWHRTLQMIGEHPLLGNGLAANLDLPGLTFPHDLYLSVLFYSGAVGFLLFATLAGLITLRLWQVRAVQDHPYWLWLCAIWINTLISGLTDLGQITKGPGPMWFIFWLPVGLVLALTAQPARRSLAPSRPSHSTERARYGES